MHGFERKEKSKLLILWKRIKHHEDILLQQYHFGNLPSYGNLSYFSEQQSQQQEKKNEPTSTHAAVKICIYMFNPLFS